MAVLLIEKREKEGGGGGGGVISGDAEAAKLVRFCVNITRWVYFLRVHRSSATLSAHKTTKGMSSRWAKGHFNCQLRNVSFF